jgi:hypothetical protein
MDENRLWGIQRAIVQLHKLQLWGCRVFCAKVVAVGIELLDVVQSGFELFALKVTCLAARLEIPINYFLGLLRAIESEIKIRYLLHSLWLLVFEDLCRVWLFVLHIEASISEPLFARNCGRIKFIWSPKSSLKAEGRILSFPPSLRVFISSSDLIGAYRR